ncbi:barstar family protein [Streptomyces sp. NPDC013740]|uniref:barstar family protein n=1 Tax=Streptomyces sp. NPDC013740 TaxID=3364867 RepID=UPI0036F5062A
MKIESGLHEVSGADIAGILDEAARQGVPAFTLSTAGRTDKEAFLEAVRQALPLDPLLGTFATRWDAVSDSLWGGLYGLGSSRAVIVWPDARPVAGAWGDYRMALDIFRDVAGSLAEARWTNGRPMQVSVYVAPAPMDGQGPPTEG